MKCETITPGRFQVGRANKKYAKKITEVKPIQVYQAVCAGNDAVKTAFSRTASLFARMACTMDLWVWHSMVRGFPTAGLQKGRHL